MSARFTVGPHMLIPFPEHPQVQLRLRLRQPEPRRRRLPANPSCPPLRAVRDSVCRRQPQRQGRPDRLPRYQLW